MTTLGKVILLNGTSSTGKSTLAKMLQLKLPEPFMHTGIDKIIRMMPVTVNNFLDEEPRTGFWCTKSTDKEGNPLTHLNLGPFAKKACATLKKMVFALVEDGFNVVLDEVAYGPEDLQAWEHALPGVKILYVGVHAPLSVLEAREYARGDRAIGLARAQHAYVHKGITYDVEVNTYTQTLEDCAARVIVALRQLEERAALETGIQRVA